MKKLITLAFFLHFSMLAISQPWEKLHNLPADVLRFFKIGETVFASAADGLYRTTDAGENWWKTAFPDQDVQSVTFLKTGDLTLVMFRLWHFTDANGSINAEYKLYKLTATASWIPAGVFNGNHSFHGCSYSAPSVSILNDSVFCAVQGASCYGIGGVTKYYFTENGGAIWQEGDCPEIPPTPGGDSTFLVRNDSLFLSPDGLVQSFFFVNLLPTLTGEVVGWAYQNGKLLVAKSAAWLVISTDQGQTFTTHLLDLPDVQQFMTHENLLVVRSGKGLHRLEFPVNVFPIFENDSSWQGSLEEFQFFGDSALFVSLNTAQTLRSTDLGASWAEKDKGLGNPDMAKIFDNGESVFIQTAAGRTYKSADGEAFEFVAAPFVSPDCPRWKLTKDSFVFAALESGDGHVLQRSSDGDSSWQNVLDLPANFNMKGMLAAGNRLYVHGSQLRFSDDNGANWATQNLPAETLLANGDTLFRLGGQELFFAVQPDLNWQNITPAGQQAERFSISNGKVFLLAKAASNGDKTLWKKEKTDAPWQPTFEFPSAFYAAPKHLQLVFGELFISQHGGGGFFVSRYPFEEEYAQELPTTSSWGWSVNYPPANVKGGSGYFFFDNHFYVISDNDGAWRRPVCALFPTVLESETKRCHGESLVFGDSLLTQPGTYSYETTDGFGCPITQVLHLSFYPDYVDTFYVAHACPGDFYFGTHVFADTFFVVNAFANGCPATKTYFIHVEPAYALTLDTTLQAGQIFLGIAPANDTVLTQNMETVFGCDSTLTWLVQVETSDEESAFEIDPVQLFPNPAGDFIWVKWTGSQACSLELTDAFGQNIKAWNVQAPFDERLDLSDLAAGAYFLRLVGNESETWRRLLKN